MSPTEAERAVIFILDQTTREAIKKFKRPSCGASFRQNDAQLFWKGVWFAYGTEKIGWRQLFGPMSMVWRRGEKPRIRGPIRYYGSGQTCRSDDLGEH